MARGPGPPLGVLSVCLGTRMLPPLLMFILVLAASPVLMEKNSFHYMESLCKNPYLQNVYRKADGAVLRSQNERNLNCVVTFQTHTVLQSFVLRFDALHLDCNDHLFIYDSAHAGGNLRVDLSCRDTKESVGIISTISNYVTLKYVTDNWGTQNNGFTLVITAVKKRPTAAGTGTGDTCTDFRCKRKEYCVSSDLVCDGVNHCADGSDESAAQCSRGDSTTLLGLPMNTVVVASVCLLLLLAAAVVAVAVCVCRQSGTGNAGTAGTTASNTMRNANTSIMGTEAAIITKSPGYLPYGLNGAGTTTTTTMLGRPPPVDATFGLLPGNALRPVGCLLGYSVVRVRLYCQAK